MNDLPSSPDQTPPTWLTEAQLDFIAAGLAGEGYLILDDVLPTEQLMSLYRHIQSLGTADFSRAGIGRDADWQLDQRIRKDYIRWLDPAHPATHGWFQHIESLRTGLNQRLFLGLWDYECHYAWYPVGSFYRRHLDAFRGRDSRRVSTTLYLNPDWQPGDGGELRLYAGEGGEEDAIVQDIDPAWGRMVMFLSEVFPHEVLPVGKARYSLTGWFRVNAIDGNNPDPPVMNLTAAL